MSGDGGAQEGPNTVPSFFVPRNLWLTRDLREMWAIFQAKTIIYVSFG